MWIILGILKLALLAAVVMGGLEVAAIVFCVVFLAHRAVSCGRGPGQHGSGWKRFFALVAVVLLGMWYLTWASYEPRRQKPLVIREPHTSGARTPAPNEMSVRHKPSRKDPRREQKSMQELWEELNQPRIDLTTGDPEELEHEATEVDWSSEVAERTSERLEGVASRVSATARRAAEVGTILGQTLVALQRVSDSSADGDAPTNEAAALADATETPTVVTAPTPVVVDVSVPRPPRPVLRPAWIDDPPKRVGNVWREIIVAGDFATRDECNREADRLLMQATARHLADLTGIPRYAENSRHLDPTNDAWVARLQEMGLGIDYIRRNIAKDEFEETVDMSVGPMKRLYTLVEFSESVDREMRALWSTYLQRQRLEVVGLGAGSILGLIGLAYGLLKVDTWTRGYYTKRLFLGAGAAIIAITWFCWTDPFRMF